MDMSSAKWSSEMAMEDGSCSFFNEYQLDTLDYSIDDLHFQTFSPQSYSSYVAPKTPSPSKPIIESCTTFVERPLKHEIKSDSWSSSCTTTHHEEHKTTITPSTSSQLISFATSDKAPKVEAGSMNYVNNINSYEGQYCSQIKQGNKRSSGAPTRSPLHAQDHVMAERKRREKLSQRFIALSAIVPGLKKTDKASVLGDTIKYLKQLEESVKALEEQTARRTVESVVFVNKSQLCSDDEMYSSCDESFTSHSTQPLPEIEARVSDRDVLIKIHCQKTKGCAVNILSEVEKLHLAVINSSVLPFTKSIFDITIVAKMEDGICMSAKDLARNLRATLLKVM